MTTVASVNRDIFFTPGIPRVLEELLRAAARDVESRGYVREIGQALAEDGNWRGELKRAAGWNGEPNAWAALTAFIKANGTDAPWWQVLKFAEGAANEGAQEFFGE